MSKPQDPVSTERPIDFVNVDDLPPGDHPLEVAARDGIGPLSARVRRVWHGDGVPCVSCGQLVLRDRRRCHHCDQDLSLEMIERMRTHSGPWYVLEHVRPFPGVSLELIVRQIRRGLLTETSIVRGPSTDFQWRFAVETPGLCRFFSRCWKCHAQVSPVDAFCLSCHSSLGFEQVRSDPDAAAGASAAPPASTKRVSGYVVTATDGYADAERAPSVDEPAPEVGVESSPPRPAKALSQHPRGTGVEAGHSRPESSSGIGAWELQALSAAVEGSALPARNPAWEAPARIGRIPASLVAVAMLFIVVAALVLVSQCRSEPRASARADVQNPSAARDAAPPRMVFLASDLDDS